MRENNAMAFRFVRFKGCVQKSFQMGLMHAQVLSFVLRSKRENANVFYVLFYAYEFLLQREALFRMSLTANVDNVMHKWVRYTEYAFIAS